MRHTLATYKILIFFLLYLSAATAIQTSPSPLATEDAPEEDQENQPSLAERAKRHFLDKDLYKERIKKAEKSYEDYMQILEHEGLYFVFTYSLPPYGIYGSNIPSELKFQLSVKVPFWRGAFWSKGSLFFAYTQTMWFQQFNPRYSSPVRDTDYKPYLFYSYPANWRLFGGRLKELRLGAIHYSNGIGGDGCLRPAPGAPRPSTCRSRSAGNRILMEVIWEYLLNSHVFGFQLSAWPYVPNRRDNPNLKDFIGYANLRLYYKYGRHFTELHVEPIIADYTRFHGAFRLGYAFKINRFISVYGQYFYGYGDSLYEYDKKVHRIGLGLRSTVH